jgi:ribonuclease P protein component
MKRKYRLIKTTDFKRVRRLGKSYAHPLVVLIVHPNTSDRIRVGVAAGRSVGNAVQRNHAKRRLRETIRTILPAIRPGWDIILLARRPIIASTHQQVKTTIYHLLKRARLLEEIEIEGKLIG